MIIIVNEKKKLEDTAGTNVKRINMYANLQALFSLKLSHLVLAHIGHCICILNSVHCNGISIGNK